jgi:outer membrane protein OmpA-like peptidoglycan-associated protein
MNRSLYWVFSGILVFAAGSCGLHSERGNARQEVAGKSSMKASEAERVEDLWSAYDSEPEVAQSPAEAFPLDEVAAFNANQSERGLVLTLDGSVLFDTDEASLKTGPGFTLDRLAAFMKRYPDRILMIEGHTDSTGEDPYNMVLSLHRANAVRRALVARGMDENRIRTIALGENFPVAANDSTTGQQLNRRVEIVLSDKEGLFSPAAQRVAATQ